MASAEADWQGFSQVFYEQLKCYICESHLNAREDRWYQCQAFHWICHDCKTVKGRCSCGFSFGTNYCQLIKAALSVDTMRFKCENLSRGCKETSDKEGMIVHQTECIYRLVKCPWIPCKSFNMVHKLNDHMENCFDIKPIKGFFGRKIELTAEFDLFDNMDAWKPRKLEIDQYVFMEVRSAVKEAFCHWIYFVGSPNEARKFDFTIDYSNSNRTFVRSDYVFSINESSESISSKCFAVRSSHFKENFTDPDNKGKFAYTIKIRNLKEEAKDDNVESGISDDDNE